MPWLGTFNFCHQSASNFILAKFLRENGQNLVHDGDALEVILPLRFANEIMNPEITIAFQQSPYLFRDPLEKRI